MAQGNGGGKRAAPNPTLAWPRRFDRAMKLAEWMHKRIPFYSRIARQLDFEEFSSLRGWLVLASLLAAGGMGIYPSEFGHIETTPMINVIMPVISCINPVLGFVCACVFSVADFAEKMVTDNVYYEGVGETGDYLGARVGYIVAYLSVVMWGVLPGLLSRWLRGRVRRWAEATAARRSVGAAYVVGPRWRVLEMIAGAVGGALGGGIANYLNIGLEAPAFLLRPTPDHTCYDLAIGNLKAGAPVTALAGAAAGAGVVALQPQLRAGDDVAPPEGERERVRRQRSERGAALEKERGIASEKKEAPRSARVEPETDTRPDAGADDAAAQWWRAQAARGARSDRGAYSDHKARTDSDPTDAARTKRFCTRCGHKARPRIRFCTRCGTPINRRG